MPGEPAALPKCKTCRPSRPPSSLPPLRRNSCASHFSRKKPAFPHIPPPVGSVPSAAHQLRTFSRGEAYPNASGVPGEPEIQAAVAAAEEGGREARCYVAVHEVGVVN